MSTKPRATYADIERLPENIVGEILNGALFTHPRPAMPHARAASRVESELDGPFDRGRGGPGGWLIVCEPEIHFPSGSEQDDVVVPDLAGWHRTRLPQLPNAAHVKIAPDWVCEVLSPSTEVVDRAEKMPIYARVGVAWAWLIDPTLKTLEIFKLEREAWRVVKTFYGTAPVRAQPFDAIELELGALWEGVEEPAK